MDKVVIITGGSRGIGAETALLAARQGYRICINYQSDEDAAHRVLEQVRALGAQAIAVRADVSIEDEVIALFHRVDAELGRVTALVNNAGTVGHKSRVDEMSEFRILKVMKTNVLGPILCAKHAVLRMSPKHGGPLARVTASASTISPPKTPPIACSNRFAPSAPRRLQCVRTSASKMKWSRCSVAWMPSWAASPRW